MTGNYFFYGSLRHLDVLEIVLGRTVAGEAAALPGLGLYWAKDGWYPLAVTEADSQADGILVRGLDAEDVARLSYFEVGFGYRAEPVRLILPDGAEVAAQAFVQEPRQLSGEIGAPWDVEAWRMQFGAEIVAAVRDFMRHYGAKSPGPVAARFTQILARAGARVRAAKVAPTTVRHRAAPGDVAVAALREPYARFFAMEEYDLNFRRFDGTPSPQVTRAVFVACDAVTVLPYDPQRDRVLVVEQFRPGPHARGDAQPWQIEAIAGRIDPGETPEHAARREAVEEAGLVLDRLLPIAQYYPSPGCSAEFLYSFVGLCDLPDGAAGVFGVEGEAEDIRGHVLSFEAFMALVASGEIGNAPTILTAYWLAQQRAGLRGA